MLNRIRLFIESQGISIRAFEQMITASNGLIRKAIANNTDIQSKWVSLIVDKYPQLNPEWLLTGNGEMLRGSPPVAGRGVAPPAHPPAGDEVVKHLINKVAEQAEELGRLRAELAGLREEREAERRFSAPDVPPVAELAGDRKKRNQ